MKIPFAQIGSQELIGVTFGANEVKFCRVCFYPNGREITALLSRDTTGMPDADISQAIRGIFNESRAKIIDVIPSHLAITKNIEIPSVDPREIKEIINLQAGRHTPFSRQEIIIDYVNIGTYKSNYTKTLLAIVARSVIKRHFDILDKAGLKLEGVLFAPEGLSWGLSKLLKIESHKSPINLIHIDTDYTDFAVVFRDKLIFVRPIPIGAVHLNSEREKYVIKFSEEIKRSFEAYQNEDIENAPSAIALTGAVQELGELEKVLSDSLHIPVIFLSYFKNLSVSEEVIRKATAIKQISFLGTAASIIGWQELKINLVPEEVRLRKQLEEKGKELIKTGIFVLAALVLIFSVLISKIFFKSLYLKKLNAVYKVSSQKALDLEKKFSKISLLRNYLANSGYSLEVLMELYGSATQDMEFNEIRYDEKGKFSIRGTAETMSTIFSFADNLKKSQYFKEVETRYTAMRRDGVRDVADFEIVCPLKK